MSPTTTTSVTDLTGSPMRIRLQRLPASILGIYGPRKELLPERMRLLPPDAAASLLAM